MILSHPYLSLVLFYVQTDASVRASVFSPTLLSILLFLKYSFSISHFVHYNFIDISIFFFVIRLISIEYSSYLVHY